MIYSATYVTYKVYVGIDYVQGVRGYSYYVRDVCGHSLPDQAYIYYSTLDNDCYRYSAPFWVAWRRGVERRRDSS